MDNGDIDPSLKDVVCILADTMKEFATSIEKLKQVANGLSHSINTLQRTDNEDLGEGNPKADDDDFDEIDRKDIEEETVWENVRDTVKEHDKETVEMWKDELNNLLVFAGLFSAVVTAFTIESYTWLQQDPSDASNALLAQISLQLSNFMLITAGNSPSSGFLNSTAPALSLSNVESSFAPTAYAVPVNILWVLSLTLSLVSAFFAITVQQWLRQLRLPPEMPARRAVQLLAIRSDGLSTWQVPSIISLLPLLLQIAVVLFLFGLFLLLRSLNTIVTVAFGVAALVGLLAFLVTTIIPLATPRCPYKTPLIPTVVVVLQFLSYPLAVAAIPIVFPFALFWKSPTIRSFSYRLPGRTYRILRYVYLFFHFTLVPYITSLGRHMFIDMGQFWLSREHQYIFLRNKDNEARLEESALAQVLLSVPTRSSSAVLESLHSSRGDELVYTFQDTILYGLRAFRAGLQWYDIIPRYRLDPELALYIADWSSVRHRRLLWQHLCRRDWERDGEVTHADSDRLTVFHELDQVFPAMRRRYAKHLFHICDHQELSEDCWTHETRPACLVLDLTVNQEYIPDKDDAATAHRFASKVYNKYYSSLDDRDKRRLFLVSTTLALTTRSKSGIARSAGITSAVKPLASALDENKATEAAISELRGYYKDDSWSQRYPAYMSPARIMQALCGALFDHVSSPLLPPSPEHLRDLTRISAALRTVCSELDYGANTRMLEACGRLDAFDVQVERIRTTVTMKDNAAIGSAMGALVRAEARIRSEDANEDGDYAVAATSSDGRNSTSTNMPLSSSSVTVGAISSPQSDDMKSVRSLKMNVTPNTTRTPTSTEYADLLRL